MVAVNTNGAVQLAHRGPSSITSFAMLFGVPRSRVLRQRDHKPPRLGTHDSVARREGRCSGARHAAIERNVSFFKKGRSITRAAFLLHHAEGGSALTGKNRWDEKAGLRRDAVHSQFIDALKGARDKGDRQ